jgi:ribosomal protein L7/L12
VNESSFVVFLHNGGKKKAIAIKRGPLATRWGREEGVSESSFVVFLHNGGEKKAIAIKEGLLLLGGGGERG